MVGAPAAVKELSPRIVVVNDEPLLLAVTEACLRACLENALVFSFGNGETVWRLLSRGIPTFSSPTIRSPA